MRTARLFAGSYCGIFLLIFSFLSSGPLHAQESSLVKGLIQNSRKESLAGVTVILRNTKNNFTTGTSTDSSGMFQFPKVPSGASYSFTFSQIGYESQTLSGYTIRPDATLSLVIEMKESAASLDQVVIVGYGAQKRVSLTSAVSQIKGEDLTKRPVQNFQQALQGLAPGLTVLDQGGLPGRGNATVRVRGVTTLNNNEALVIVDGVEQRLIDINPDDIESVSILKDAASTAIYGSRAANGVVLITTKRAKSGKVVVNFNNYYALQTATNSAEMMDIGDYMRMQQIAYQNAGGAVPDKFSDQSIDTWVNATDRYKYPLPNTWFQTLFNTAPQLNSTIAVAGGNENFRARMSARYMNQDGIIPNTEAKVREVRISTDFKASKKINFSADANYRYNSNLSPFDVANNVFDKITSGSLWAVPKYPDGTYGLSTQGNNPLMFAEIGGLTRESTDYFVGNLKGEWQIIEGLKFSTQFAIRARFLTSKEYRNAFTNTDSITKITRVVANSTLSETRDNLREYTLNNLLTYERGFGRHDLKALLGYSEINNKQTVITAYRERFYNNDIQSIGQGVNDGTKSNDGYDAEFGLRSFFGRLNYGFDDKYLFEANARYDGSSRFTGDNQYSFFPSFSGAWRLSQENFWDAITPVVNEFKIRGSWGKTGNQSVGLYSYYESLSPSTYTFGNLPVAAYAPTTLANRNITWETTTQTDIGVDATLFGRLSLTFDYYKKRTDGILLALPIPAAIGMNPPNQNAGMVDNKGVEITASYSNTIGKKFAYSIGGNFAVNNNKVVSLAGTGPYISGDDINPRYIIKEGLPINAHWGYTTAGFFQSVDEISKYPTYTSNTKPGDTKYVDLNGDGKINADDMTMIGTSFPKYTYSLNGSLRYSGFELNFFFQGAADVDTRLAGPLAEMGNNEGFVHSIYTNNYWTPTHTDARFPRPVKRDLRNVATSDMLMIDASYLRLKNVQLVYNLPNFLISKLSLNKMSVYVSGTNLLTFSELNDWNFDPETQSGRLQYYPQSSLFTFGINLQF
jgi:TonB-linked SusC/RagA family outer membrane protein